MNSTWPTEPEGARSFDETVSSKPNAVEPVPDVPLPTVRFAEGSEPTADFQLREVLGVGGMGHVVSAWQTALDRPVAAKFLKDKDSDRALLLREAIVTGRLEHPNIVPVHLLAQTDDGDLFFAMKQVEGTPWTQQLAKQRPLVEELEILTSVCDALAFAHARGVIHRDVKPDNVLLGPFGEVYLVDWGLALSLRPDAFLPHIGQASVGGTPAYAAPEMAAVTHEHLGPRTDVYLLGATLHHLLNGRPPHRGQNVSEVLATAARGEPPIFSSEIPTELANVCRRAMSKSPDDRFADAQEFKSALTRYLRHREAFELSSLASKRLEQLERAVSAESQEASRLGIQVHSLFTECRFGFEQVRRLWPDFDDARRGLERAITVMIGSELGRGDARAARILLSQLQSPEPQVVASVEAAEAAELQRERRITDLERQAKDHEVDLAVGPKRIVSQVFAIFMATLSLMTQFLVDTERLHLTTGVGVLIFAIPIVFSEVVSLLVRSDLKTNLAQTKIIVALRVNAWAVVALWLIAWRLELSVHAALVLTFTLVAANWTLSSVQFSRRARLVGIPLAVAAMLSMFFPRFVFAIGGVCAGVGFWWLGASLREREKAV